MIRLRTIRFYNFFIDGCCGVSLKVRFRVLVSGRVQGVFFRSETRRLANSYNVTGWIRNLSDGRVEAVFEGEDYDVDKLVKFMQKGSRSAIVNRTEVLMESYKCEFKDFRIIW